jgi:CubicO group peptidase (beta-lactamase class C family)
MTDLPRTTSALTQVLAESATSGATLHVVHHGQTIADIALGQTPAGQPLTSEHWVPWFSISKLAATLAVACAWEQHLLAPEDTVADHIPEFAGGGKHRIRIRHLLTHTAPLRGADRDVGGHLPDGRETLLERIIGADADPDWEPGQRAAYLGHAGYLLLDEIIARRAGTTFAAFQRHHVLHPLGLRADLGRPADHEVLDVPWLGDPRLAARVAGHDVGLGYPSACMAGPFAEAVRLCELLRGRGTLARRRVLAPGTAAALLTDHRPPELVDEAAGRPRRWGLGIALDQPNWAPFSPRSFGATGGTSCSVFSDPDTDTTAALHFLGNTTPADRLNRDQQVHQALHDDLTTRLG